MTESMIVEAVRAAQASSAADPAMVGAANAPAAVADPAAVARFQAAMGVNPAGAVDRSAQVNNQGILHRIRALAQLDRMHGPSSGELVELQYEVMNLSFQQEVVTKVADKSSNAIQTLVKNQ